MKPKSWSETFHRLGVLLLKNHQGLKSTTTTWHLPWMPLAIVITPAELCTIYGHKWPAPVLFGAAVP